VRKITDYCEICNTPKGEGNRWLLGIVNAYGVCLSTWDEVKARKYLAFCTDKCALTWQSRELDKMGR
jgi:hypothetical protein